MRYKLTGEYYTAPDRGSPDGDWNPFQHSFQAGNDSAARAHTKKHLDKEYPGVRPDQFRKLSLMNYKEVDLASIFA
ncbi:MAG TPA: hypothetical protein VFY28_02285 [Candidatus Paceibacterota bacterium]|nr:hypothetical protein [Candidatus Paceibacterota bacterium]